MTHASLTRRALIAATLACAVPAQAQTLDKVSFGTNWVAEAEHGGFYQAVADGTYKKYGLDVTIVPGGPQVNNRLLLLSGKIDFYMGGNMLQSFSAVAENIPTVVVAAAFQKEPQVLLAHPGQGFDNFEDLKKATLFIASEGQQTYLQMDAGRVRLRAREGEALHVQSRAVPGRQAQRDAGLCDVGALRGREGRQVQAENLPDRRPRLQHLLDPDRDAPRGGGEAARPGAALRRCLGDRLVQLPLRRQQGRERADPQAQSGNDPGDDRLFGRQDEGVRHRRFRRTRSSSASAR